MHKILIIDDAEDVARVMQRLFHRRGLSLVEVAGSGEEGLEKLSTFAADLVISDFRMPEMNGHEVLDKIRAVAPNAIRVLMSAYATPESVRDVWGAAPGTFHFFFSKPWDDEQLIASLRSLLAQGVPPSV